MFSKCQPKRNVLKLVYESCAKDLTQLSVISGEKEITISNEEVYEFCVKFPNLKVFQFKALDLLIREESIAFMLSLWPNIEKFILLDSLSSSERKVRVKNYKGFCFIKISSKLRVIGMPALLLNRRALQLIADKPLQQLSLLLIH